MLLLGEFTYDNGDKYEGQWVDGKREGKGNGSLKNVGVLLYSNGNKYEGEWADDKMNGQGKYSFKHS